MRTLFNIAVLAAALAAASSPCFALTDVFTVTPERAKELGMEVRSQPPGGDTVSVSLEFKVEGELKDFTDVNLQVGEGKNQTVTAPLREDRSKPGRVVVTFSAGRAQLGKLSLWVHVKGAPGVAGSTVYHLRVGDFVEAKKER